MFRKTSSNKTKLSISPVFERGLVIFARVYAPDNHIVTFENTELASTYSFGNSNVERSKSYHGSGNTLELALGEALRNFHFNDKVMTGRIRYPEQIQIILQNLEKWLTKYNGQLRAVHDEGEILVRLEGMQPMSDGTCHLVVFEGVGPTFYSSVVDALNNRLENYLETSNAYDTKSDTAEVLSIFTAINNNRL